MNKLELLKRSHLAAMYLIAGNFYSNTLIFIWLPRKRIPKGVKIKTSILLTYIGQKGREIYETFTYEPGDEMKLIPFLPQIFRIL